MRVQIPERQVYDHGMAAVTFPIECDGVEYRGAVSAEALWEHFGLDNPHAQAALDAFAANRHLVEAKIWERFSARRPDDIFLRASDF